MLSLYNHTIRYLLLSSIVVGTALLLPKQTLADQDQCLLNALASADPSATVADIRSSCEQPQTPKALTPKEQVTPGSSTDVGGPQIGVVQRRISAEDEIAQQPFVLTAHRPNYVLPYTYNSKPNQENFSIANPGQAIDEQEAQFQISFKFPLALQWPGENNDLYFGFTTRAWWQLYNSNLSSPFRETTYEPELFLRHKGGPQIGPIKVAGWDFGFAHQSNGRSEPLSRSWNRINANLALETGNFAFALRTWYRIPEDDEDDDNPSLHRYLGYGDIRLLYGHNDRVFTAMYRPGTDKSAFELTWSLPLWQQLRLYLIYFNGYGESLLDYNHRVQRIGIGFGLNDYVDTPALLD